MRITGNFCGIDRNIKIKILEAAILAGFLAALQLWLLISYLDWEIGRLVTLGLINSCSQHSLVLANSWTLDRTWDEGRLVYIERIYCHNCNICFRCSLKLSTNWKVLMTTGFLNQHWLNFRHIILTLIGQSANTQSFPMNF